MDPASWNWPAISIFIATFCGPIAAIQAQKYLERRQEQQRLKDGIFRALMATRFSRTSQEHVQALNSIDLTFGSKKSDGNVISAWNAYRDCLNTANPKEKDAEQRMNEKRYDAFLDLLLNMSQALGYPFDRTHIKNSAYSPIAHGDIQRDQDTIRVGLAELVSGKRSLKVTNVEAGSVGSNLLAPTTSFDPTSFNHPVSSPETRPTQSSHPAERSRLMVPTNPPRD